MEDQQLDGLDNLIPDLEPVATSNQWWWDGAERAIRYLAEAGQPFSIQDVHGLGVPDPDHCNRAGAAILTASRRGLIRRIGDTHSTRRSRHGGRIGLWVGVAQTETSAA